MPHLKALVERHKDEPFAVVGINCNDGEEAYREGLEKHGLTWINAYHEGRNPVAELYQVRGFPTYYLLDAEGRVVASGHDGKAFDEPIAKLLAEMAARSEDEADATDEGGEPHGEG
jgi:hypothetical protein